MSKQATTGTSFRTRGRFLARSLAAAVAAVVVAFPAAAQAGALDQFKSFVASTKAAKGDFTQRQVKAADGSGKATRPASGTFVFERPGKFVWTYRIPYEQVLQADGDKLYIYDKDLNQVTVKKLGNALGSSPAAILFGSNQLEKNFSLKDEGSRDGLEWLQAVPKTKDTTFEKIDIGMKDGLPRAMELHDTFGQVSVLNFSNFEKNPAISDNLFHFVVPKGADVFQQ